MREMNGKTPEMGKRLTANHRREEKATEGAAVQVWTDTCSLLHISPLNSLVLTFTLLLLFCFHFISFCYI